MTSLHDQDEKRSHEYIEGHADEYDNQVALAHEYQPNTEEERKLVRRIDKRIVVSPTLPLVVARMRGKVLTSGAAVHMGAVHHVLPRSRQHR